VRLGRVAERLGAGSQHLRGGSVRLNRMPLGGFQPLAGGSGPAPSGVQASLPELLKSRADGVKPSVDVPPAA
jgi:hypothetical protein